MAYVNDTLLQTFRYDNLVAMGYNIFRVAELLEHQYVLHKVWISLAKNKDCQPGWVEWACWALGPSLLHAQPVLARYS